MADDVACAPHHDPPIILRAGRQCRGAAAVERRETGGVGRLVDQRAAEVGVVVDLDCVARRALDAIP